MKTAHGGSVSTRDDQLHCHGGRRLTIPCGLGLADVALERVVPRDVVRALGEVLLVLDLEADAEERLARVLVVAHLGDAVADLYARACE